MRITRHDGTSSPSSPSSSDTDRDAEEIWGNAREEKTDDPRPESLEPSRQLYRKVSQSTSKFCDSLDSSVLLPLRLTAGIETRRYINDDNGKQSSQVRSHSVENLPSRPPYRPVHVANETILQTGSSHSAERVVQNPKYNDRDNRHRSRSLGVRRQLYRQSHTTGTITASALFSPDVIKEQTTPVTFPVKERQHRSRNLYKSAFHRCYRIEHAAGDTVSSTASSSSIALGRIRSSLYKDEFQPPSQNLNVLSHCSRRLYKMKNNIRETVVCMSSSSSGTVTIQMHPAGDGNGNGQRRYQSSGLRNASQTFYRNGHVMVNRTSISGSSNASDVAESECQSAKDVSQSSNSTEPSIEPSQRSYKECAKDSPEVMAESLSTDEDAKKLCVIASRDGGVIHIPRCLEPWSRFFHQAYRERDDRNGLAEGSSDGIALSDAATKQLCPSACKDANLQRRRPQNPRDRSQRPRRPDTGRAVKAVSGTLSRSGATAELLLGAGRAGTLRWPVNAKTTAPERALRRDAHRIWGPDRSFPVCQTVAHTAALLIDGNYLTRSVTWSRCGSDSPRDCFVLFESFERRDLQD